MEMFSKCKFGIIVTQNCIDVGNLDAGVKDLPVNLHHGNNSINLGYNRAQVLMPLLQWKPVAFVLRADDESTLLVALPLLDNYAAPYCWINCKREDI